MKNKLFNQNRVNDLFIDLYNEQTDYLTSGDLDYLETFERYIGEVPIDYDIKDYYDMVDTYTHIENYESVHYDMICYKDLLNIFNAAYWQSVFSININYYALDIQIVNKIFNELDITDLESINRNIRYYDFDAYAIFGYEKILYDMETNKILSYNSNDIIKNVISEYKKTYEYQEILHEFIDNTINEHIDEYITRLLKERIREYNRYNVPVTIKPIYEYSKY